MGTTKGVAWSSCGGIRSSVSYCSFENYLLWVLNQAKVLGFVKWGIRVWVNCLNQLSIQGGYFPALVLKRKKKTRWNGRALRGAECELRQKTTGVSTRMARACKKLANRARRSTYEEGSKEASSSALCRRAWLFWKNMHSWLNRRNWRATVWFHAENELSNCPSSAFPDLVTLFPLCGLI